MKHSPYRLDYEIQSFGRDECLACPLPECVHVNAKIDLNLCPIEIKVAAARKIKVETSTAYSARNLRRQSILYALTSETPKCHSEIAQDLGISRWTLYRDINILLEEGRLIKQGGTLTSNGIFLLPRQVKRS